MQQPDNKRRKPDLTNIMYGKIPPQNKEAEKAVIGQLLSGSSRIDEVLEVLPDETRFYVDAHQRIYRAICACHHAGMQIDPTTVMTQLIKTDELEVVGGSYALLKITENLALDYTIMNHCSTILECHKRRDAIKVAGELMSLAYGSADEIDTVLHESDRLILEIISDGDIVEAVELRELIVPFNEDLFAAMSSDGSLTGVDTGFPELNDVTKGWQGTDLVILAARPSVGKTAFAVNLAMNAVTGAKVTPTAIFSLEMGKKQLMKRIASAMSRVDLEKINDGTVTTEEQAKLSEAMNAILKMPIHIDDTFGLSVNRFEARAKKLVRTKGVGMIIIDYLQLMQVDEKGNREQEIAKISRGLKKVAKNLGIPVLALSQLSRGIESRTGDKAEPMLSDLRESGAIEQDADMVIFIYHMKDPTTGETRNIINIAKHRNGKLKKLERLKFFANIQKWMNPDDAEIYTGKGAYQNFAGMRPPDERTEAKKVISFDNTPDDMPF